MRVQKAQGYFLSFGEKMAKRTAFPKCTRNGRATELNSLGFFHLCFAFVREYCFSHDFICSQSKWNSISLFPWFVNGRGGRYQAESLGAAHEFA